MPTITVQYKEGLQASVSVDRLPNECPLCKHHIAPIEWGLAYGRKGEEKDDFGARFSKSFRCPRDGCERVFLAEYQSPTKGAFPGNHFLSDCTPRTLDDRNFSETVQKVSPEFCLIFNQANAAEQQGLARISGPGYRKALEFLIKDYLCRLHPGETEAIQATLLGKCIKQWIANDRIVAVASRAAWLGNDETHYLRVWKDKDLQDLRNLIDLTVHWIEMEELTKQIIGEMPESKSP